MNKQRKVLITTTYNEMGIIINTKAEEVTQPNLQPTCNQLATDCISRQTAIDAFDGTKVDETDCTEYDIGYNDGIDFAVSKLSVLPSAQPRCNFLEKAQLSGEGTTSDLINRSDAIYAVYKRIKQIGFEDNVDVLSIRQAVREVPSAQPEKCENCGNFDKTRLLIPQPDRKVGKWIYHPEIKNVYGGKCIECSECGEKYMVVYIEDEKYCRNCGSYNGAKMEETK